MIRIILLEHIRDTSTKCVVWLGEPDAGFEAQWVRMARGMARALMHETGNAYEVEIEAGERRVRMDGAGVYPSYEPYWSAAIRAKRAQVLR